MRTQKPRAGRGCSHCHRHRRDTVVNKTKLYDTQGCDSQPPALHLPQCPSCFQDSWIPPARPTLPSSTQGGRRPRLTPRPPASFQSGLRSSPEVSPALSQPQTHLRTQGSPIPSVPVSPHSLAASPPVNSPGRTSSRRDRPTFSWSFQAAVRVSRFLFVLTLLGNGEAERGSNTRACFCARFLFTRLLSFLELWTPR